MGMPGKIWKRLWIIRGKMLVSLTFFPVPQCL